MATKYPVSSVRNKTIYISGSHSIVIWIKTCLIYKYHIFLPMSNTQDRETILLRLIVLGNMDGSRVVTDKEGLLKLSFSGEPPDVYYTATVIALMVMQKI